MENNYRNNIQDKRLEKVEKHIETTNKEMGDVKVDLAKVKSDVCWLKKSYWIVATASVGGLIAAVINLLLTNN